jgi:TonB family protein
MRLSPVPLLLLSVLFIAAAPAPVVVEASFKTKPTGDDVNRLFPEAAMRARVGGRVKVRCTITVEGALTNCKAIEEDPPGYGFGEAGVKLLSRVQFNPKTIDGKPVESERTIPLSFAKPDGPYLEPAPTPDAKTSMACLGLALDDQVANPSLRSRDVATVWYSLANFTALLQGQTVPEFLDAAEESRNRAARLRQDPAQAKLRGECEGALDRLRAHSAKRRGE